jgi:hypothetical protein
MTDHEYGGFIDPGYTPPPETRPPEDVPTFAAAPPGWPAPAQQPPMPTPPMPYYGYPAFPQPPYPQPPYPQFPYPQFPYPQPPPARRRRGLLIGTCVAGAAIVALVAALLVGNHSSKRAADNGSPGHTLIVPDASGDYTRMTGNVADRMAQEAIDTMTSASPGYGDVYAKAKIGIYSHPGMAGPALVFIGLAATDDPTIALELRSRPASAELDQAFLGAGVSDTTDVDAGPLGGVMRCSKTSTAAGDVDICAWADRSILGLMVIGRFTGRSELGQIAQTFRNNAER